jgi:translation initiation factor 2B subunit (eIF-2B alpha/beta/delta family)
MARAQVPVRVVVDAALQTAVEGADLVLVGSDAITRQGVVNKIGTHPLAVAASQQDVPFVVATETRKAWRKNQEPAFGLGRAQVREAREVWDRPPAGVDVVNLTFDRTPGDLVTAVMSEQADEPFDAFWRRIESTGYAKRVREEFGDELS